MTETISREDIEAAWMGGIWDGEGCFHTGIDRRGAGRLAGSYHMRLEVVCTNPYLIQRMTQILHRWGIKFVLIWQAANPKTKNHQDRLRVMVQSYRGCRDLTQRILPYLTAKKDEAQAVFDFCEWRIMEFNCDIRGKGPVKNAMQLMVYKRKEALHHELRRIKDIRYRLQRLPRGYSEPLNLDNLETWIDENGAGRRTGKREMSAEERSRRYSPASVATQRTS